MRRSFLGKGLAFPLRVSNRGTLAMSEGERSIEESVRIVLGTAPGERVMRPEFGCRVHELIFHPNNHSTASLAAFYATEALVKWEPRIRDVHVDAHADVNDEMFGERETHGTVFRRAYEEGLIIPEKTYQVGLRGTGYTAEDFTEAAGWGFQQFLAPDLWHRSLANLGAEIRRDIGSGTRTYVSYDIDSLDPAYAPGTGTPEIGGLTTPQAMELIRALKGVSIVGGDLVEVSPPYDPSGNTALTAANLFYELLCVLPGVSYR